MISVTVAVNGRTLIHRFAVNTTTAAEHDPLKPDTYAVDDGRKISHVRSKGAAELAIKMLIGVHEVDLNPGDLDAYLALHGATKAPRKVVTKKPRKSKTK